MRTGSELIRHGPEIYRDLLISGIPYDRKDRLNELCSKFGTVVRCDFVPSSPTPSVSRTAFLSMHSHLEACAVLVNLQGCCDLGAPILISWDLEKTMENYKRLGEVLTQDNGGNIAQILGVRPGSASSIEKIKIYCKIGEKEVVLAEINPQALQSLVETLNSNSGKLDGCGTSSPVRVKECSLTPLIKPQSTAPDGKMQSHRQINRFFDTTATPPTAAETNSFLETFHSHEAQQNRFEGVRSNSQGRNSSMSLHTMIPRSLTKLPGTRKTLLQHQIKISPASKIHKETFDYDFQHVLEQPTFWTHMLWIEDENPVIHVWIGVDQLKCNPPIFVTKINQEVTQFYRQAQLVPNFRPAIEQPVAIRLNDQTWTRGLVVELNGIVVYVERIDIGGYEEVDIEADSTVLQPLDAQFAIKCPRMIKARIDGLTSVFYSEDLAELLRLMYYKDGVKIPLEAAVATRDPVLTLRMYGSGYADPYLIPATTCLVSDMHKNAVPEIQFGFVLFGVPLSCSQSDYDFLLINWKDLLLLEEIEGRIQEAAKERLPVVRQSGYVNAVFRSGVYQRCFIYDFLPSGSVKFELVDFGEISEAPIENFVGLPAEFQTESPAQMSRIENLDRTDIFSRVRAHDRLESLAKDFLSCAYQVVGTEGDLSVVRIWDPKDMSLICPKTVNKMAWLKELKATKSASMSIHSFTENPTSLSVGHLNYERPICCGDELMVKPNIVNGDWFTAVINEKFYQRPDFQEMASSLQSHCSRLPLLKSFPKPDTLVYALFSEDGLWYRGVTTSEANGNKVLVTFVDYGNNEGVALNDIRLMDDQWLSVPRGSVVMAELSYEPVNGALTENERSLLKNFIELKTCRFEVIDNLAQLGMVSGIMRIPVEGKMVLLADEMFRRGPAVRATSPRGG